MIRALFSGQALAYVTSPRGACHNHPDFFTVEMGGTLDEIGLTMPERWRDSGEGRTCYAPPALAYGM